MVHLGNTPPQFVRVMRPVRLALLAFIAPFWASVGFADICVQKEEGFVRAFGVQRDAAWVGVDGDEGAEVGG